MRYGACKKVIKATYTNVVYLLCFFNRMLLGKEDTIDEDCEHDDVVKILIGGEINTHGTKFVPRSKYKN